MRPTATVRVPARSATEAPASGTGRAPPASSTRTGNSERAGAAAWASWTAVRAMASATSVATRAMVDGVRDAKGRWFIAGFTADAAHP